MSFLEKFKGKTTILTKEDVGGILGRVNSNPNVPFLPIRPHLSKTLTLPLRLHSPAKTKSPENWRKFQASPKKKTLLFSAESKKSTLLAYRTHSISTSPNAKKIKNSKETKRWGRDCKNSEREGRRSNSVCKNSKNPTKSNSKRRSGSNWEAWARTSGVSNGLKRKKCKAKWW